MLAAAANARQVVVVVGLGVALFGGEHLVATLGVEKVAGCYNHLKNTLDVNMQPRFLTSVLLFVSGYSPLFLILAIQDFSFHDTMRFANPKAVLFLFLLIIVSVGLLWFTVSKIGRGSMSVKVKSIKNRSSDLVNYTIPYILSFFGFDLSDIADIISLSIFLSIMLIITIQTKAIFLNPVLAMMGYGLYDLRNL